MASYTRETDLLEPLAAPSSPAADPGGFYSPPGVFGRLSEQNPAAGLGPGPFSPGASGRGYAGYNALPGATREFAPGGLGHTVYSSPGPMAGGGAAQTGLRGVHTLSPYGPQYGAGGEAYGPGLAASPMLGPAAYGARGSGAAASANHVPRRCAPLAGAHVGW